MAKQRLDVSDETDSRVPLRPEAAPLTRIARWVAVLSLAVLSNCSAVTDGSDPSTPHTGAGDVLVVLTEPGMKGAYAPSKTPWYYTQGFLICRHDSVPDDVVPVLRSVSYNTKQEPLEVIPVIRRIPAENERQGPPDGWTPMLDSLGRPGAFDTPVRGDFSYDFDGTEVTASCKDASESRSAKMELEIVMKVPKAGADIDGFTITYDVDGKSQKVQVPWQMIGCGTKSDPSICSPG